MSFRSVMLVDDNPFDNEIHRMALVRSGAVAEPTCVVVAEGGEQAMDLLDKGLAESHPCHPPALILVDINMPRMNGFEFVEALAEWVKASDHGSLDSVVVMMLSSSVLPADRARADALEIVRGYIQKPLTKARALQLLEEWGGGTE